MSWIRNEWFWGLVLFAGGLITCQVLGFEGLYGQDAYEYERFAEAIVQWMRSGEQPGDFFWPVNYPLLGAMASMPLRSASLALQVISLLSHALTFVIAAKALKRFAPGPERWKVPFAFVAIGLSPILLRHAPLVMADATGMMCIAAGLYFALCYRETGKWHHALLATASLAMAFMTRYAAAVPAMVPALVVLAQVARRRQWVVLLPMGIAAAAVLLPHFLLRSEAPASFTHHPWLQGWNPANLLRRHFVTPDGDLHFAVPNALFVLFAVVHPGYMLLGAPLLVFLRRPDFRDAVWRIAGATAGIYLLFLAGIPYQNIRFLSLVVPIVGLLLWWPFARIAERWLMGRLAAAGLLAFWLGAQLTLAWLGTREMARQVRLERTVTEALSSMPAEKLYSFSWEGVLRHYHLPQIPVSIFERRMETCEEGLLLIQPEVVESQWKGKLPSENWQFFKNQCELELIQEFDKGWKLFRVNPKSSPPPR